MGNVFLNIPVPAANGAGVAVDVSAMGKTKSFVIGGGFRATVNVEYATDTGNGWAPLTTFHGPGNITLEVACGFIRAVTSDYESGTPNLDVGGTDAGTTVAVLTADGAAVSIATLPAFKTVVVPVNWVGVIEASEDGNSWAQIFAFSVLQPNGASREFVAQFARAIGGVDGVAADVVIAGAADDSSGGGGGTTIDVQSGGTPIGTYGTINFTGNLEAVNGGGGGVADASLKNPVPTLNVGTAVPVTAGKKLNVVGDTNQLLLENETAPVPSSFLVENNGDQIWDVSPVGINALDPMTLRLFRRTITSGLVALDILSPGTPTVNVKLSASDAAASQMKSGLLLQQNADVAKALEVVSFLTGVTVDKILASMSSNSMLFDTTGGPLEAVSLELTAAAARAAGTDPLTNVALRVNAAGGDDNYAYESTNGKMVQTDEARFASGIRLGGTAGPIAVNGVGSPEGVVTAPVGSLYWRTDVNAESNLYSKQTGVGNTGWVPAGSGGSSTPWLREIQVLSTDADTPTIFPSGIPYVQFAMADGNYAVGGFYCDYTGNIEIVTQYAMSNANTGDVEMTFSVLQTAAGADPATPPTSFPAFVFTPGNDVNMHELDDGVAAVLQLAVVAGQNINVIFQRSIGGLDTHTGDYRILRMFARQA